MTTENTDKGQTHTEADSQGHCALGDGSVLSVRWYTKTPRIPLCSDMVLTMRKPRGKHVAVNVVPIENPAPWPEVEARIRSRTQPDTVGSLDRADFRDLENLLLSLMRESKRRANEFRPKTLLWKANWKDAIHYSQLAKKLKRHADTLSPNNKAEERDE